MKLLLLIFEVNRRPRVTRMVKRIHAALHQFGGEEPST